MVSPVLTPGLYTAWDLAGKRPAATSIIRMRIRGRRGKSVAYPIIVESQLYSVCSRPHAVLTAGEAFDYSNRGFEGLVGMLVLKSKKTEIIPLPRTVLCAKRNHLDRKPLSHKPENHLKRESNPGFCFLPRLRGRGLNFRRTSSDYCSDRSVDIMGPVTLF